MANKHDNKMRITENEEQTTNAPHSVGASPLNFGTATVPPPGPNSVFKNSRTLLPPPTKMGTSIQSRSPDISIPIPTNTEKPLLSWAEEQRIKKLITEFENIEYTFQHTDEDPLLKLKSQVSFLLNKAMKVIQIYSPTDLCQMMERGLGNLLYFN